MAIDHHNNNNTINDEGRDSEQSRDAIELTVLMPCLNEARTVEVCIKKALSYCETHNINSEVVIADNGSDDGSVELAEAAGARVVHATSRGYGAALIEGIQHARGRFVIMGDADDSYDFSALDSFIRELRAGNDLVIGNRFKGGIEQGAMPALHKYIGNPVLTWLGQLFFHNEIGDFHCGLRGFNRDRMQQLGLKCTGMEFASEMIVKASLADFSISEVPTTLSKDGRDRPPHLRSWRDGWRHLVFLLLLAPRWLFYYPGLLLVGVGVLIMAILSVGPMHLGGVELGVNTLAFSAAFVVCGVQSIFFSGLAMLLAVDVGIRKDSWMVKVLRESLTIEKSLLLGLILITGGLFASGQVLGIWQGSDFGPLEPQRSLRMVIPGATALVVGVQVIFMGFFVALINLLRQKK